MVKQRGVTLVALVVTVIVTIILVGITAATFDPKSGYLVRAKEAKQKSMEKEIKEYLFLARDEILASGELDQNKILSALIARVEKDNVNKEEKRKFKIQSSNYSESTGEYNFQISYNGKTYNISIEAK